MAPPRPDPFTAFASNEIRLTPVQWLAAIAVVLAVLVSVPPIWEAIEGNDFGEDYRLPFRASEDYWLYERFVEHAAARGEIVVIGDSVIWGEFVAPGETLTHALNGGGVRSRFANGGLNGLHPLAMAGLVERHRGALGAAGVVLHLNLLWMSSPERDLSSPVEQSFNHVELVPQLSMPVPSYRADADRRLGIVVDRSIPYRAWVKHIRAVAFDSLDLPRWTFGHPYHDILARLPLDVPRPAPGRRRPAVPWNVGGVEVQEIGWLALDRSLQWRAFRETVAKLEERRVPLFVLVGPFNEHMLTPASRRRYRRLLAGVRRWLIGRSVEHFIPDPLPSEEYGDASHPLAVGYERLARSLRADHAFRRWLAR